MSEFEFSCPYCKTVMKAEEEWAGMTANCPICNKEMIIPQIIKDSTVSTGSLQFAPLTKKVLLACCGLFLVVCAALSCFLFSGKNKVQTKTAPPETAKVVEVRKVMPSKGTAEAAPKIETAVLPVKKSKIIKADKIFEYNGVKIEMMKIPRGSFFRKGEKINLPQDYWMGKLEVTNRQFAVVSGNQKLYDSLTAENYDKPVTSVSWFAAKAFCDKLNLKYSDILPEGYKFNLPTGDQWEYACRAGTATAYSYGDKPDINKMVCVGSSLKLGSAVYQNNFGLYNMHGSIREWCLEWGDLGKQQRRTCGGGYNTNAQNCSSSFRSYSWPAGEYDVGFRVALVPVELEYVEKIPERFILADKVKLEMVKIPKGSFVREDGKTITITKDFWMGKFELTKIQYNAIMRKNFVYPRSKSELEEKDYPKDNTSWIEGKIICRKLNERYKGMLPEGYHFSMPTMAQWEYACRAGTTTAFSYGDISDVQKMNFDGTQPYGGAEPVKSEERIQRTVKVGAMGYKNAFGLYDMHGNVSEWCLDYYNRDTYKITVDPIGLTDGKRQSFRGGSYSSSAKDCLPSQNYCSTGNYISRIDIGFRIALVPVNQ